MSIYVQAQNLTDERSGDDESRATPSWLEYQTYGRRCMLGATYKFGARSAAAAAAAAASAAASAAAAGDADVPGWIGDPGDGRLPGAAAASTAAAAGAGARQLI